MNDVSIGVGSLQPQSVVGADVMMKRIEHRGGERFVDKVFAKSDEISKVAPKLQMDSIRSDQITEPRYVLR